MSGDQNVEIVEVDWRFERDTREVEGVQIDLTQF